MKGLVFIVLAFCVQVAVGVTSSEIVNKANSYIDSTKWSYASSYGTGKDSNKCNQFVYDVLKAVGTGPPSRSWFRYSPIGAGEWGNPSSTYLTSKRCWKNCAGNWQSGDVIGDGVHVGIITASRKTTSARDDKVVKIDWGFRSIGTGSRNSITACWRYDYTC